MGEFNFAKELAKTLNSGQESKEIGKYITEESIKELEYLLKK